MPDRCGDLQKVCMKISPGYIIPEKDQTLRAALLYSLTNEASNRLTICEQLRFIYDSVHQLPDGELRDDLIEKLLEAFNMGKKMNARLAHYKRQYLSTSGRTGRNLIALEYTQEREQMRRQRG